MTGLDTTFDTLTTTGNDAAIRVLEFALGDPDPQISRRAIAALASRPEPQSGSCILRHWPQLKQDNVRVLQQDAGHLVDAVAKSLRGKETFVREAIDAASMLDLFSYIPDIVQLAESHAQTAVREDAAGAALRLVCRMNSHASPQGITHTVRTSIVARLARSVEKYAFHRNRDLVDAFLVASVHCDGQLQKWLSPKSPHRVILLERMRTNMSDDMADLLASFIKRQQLDDEVVVILKERTDSVIGSMLLKHIGRSPCAAVINNLRRLGWPACFDLLDYVTAHQSESEHAAMIQMATYACESPLTLLRLVTSLVPLEEPTVIEATASVLANLQPLSPDEWLRAAIEAGSHFEERDRLSDHALLFCEVIDLLTHGDMALVRAVQHLLSNFKAESLLSRFVSLDVTQQQGLGVILGMLDISVVQWVRDRLRHPVMQNRLDAIEAAMALGYVDSLQESFTHIVRNDHQEARAYAARALGNAKSTATLRLLQEMLAMPESSARDEAARAILKRTRKELPRAQEPSPASNESVDLEPTVTAEA